MLNRAFSEHNRFKEFTDEEMSAEIGHFPIFSFRPEDLPHTKSFLYSFNDQEIQERAEVLHKKIKSAYPKYNLPINAIIEMAASRTAFVHAFGQGGPTGFEPEAFFLLRPSLGLTFSDKLAVTDNLSPSVTRNALTQNKINFIDTAHEFCHILNSAKNSRKASDYEEELSADSYALDLFKIRGGNEEEIRAYINARALGFIGQSPKYWLAPALDAKFSNHFFESKPTQQSVWSSYAELRLRVAMNIVDASVAHISSSIIKDGLFYWSKSVSWQGPQLVVNAIKSFDDIRNNHPDFKKPELILTTLADCIQSSDVDEVTAKCGMQVLSATQELCPKLMPNISFPPLIGHFNNG